jgi:hypothetical protein
MDGFLPILSCHDHKKMDGSLPGHPYVLVAAEGIFMVGGGRGLWNKGE